MFYAEIQLGGIASHILVLSRSVYIHVQNKTTRGVTRVVLQGGVRSLDAYRNNYIRLLIFESLTNLL